MPHIDTFLEHWLLRMTGARPGVPHYGHYPHGHAPLGYPPQPTSRPEEHSVNTPMAAGHSTLDKLGITRENISSLVGHVHRQKAEWGRGGGGGVRHEGDWAQYVRDHVPGYSQHHQAARAGDIQCPDIYPKHLLFSGLWCKRREGGHNTCSDQL